MPVIFLSKFSIIVYSFSQRIFKVYILNDKNNNYITKINDVILLSIIDIKFL